MQPLKVLGLVLIAGGVLGLFYGSFSYSQETHRATFGALVFSIHDTHTINVPAWAGVVAIVLGVILLLRNSGRS